MRPSSVLVSINVFAVGFATSCGTVPAPVPAETTPASMALRAEPAAAGARLFPGAGTPAPLPAPLSTDVSFVSLEGPFWVASATGGGTLLFSDVVEANAPGARIYRFDPGTRHFSVVPYPSSASSPVTSTNGLAVDGTGSLLACERYNARLIRLDPAGQLAVVADRGRAGLAQVELALNAPNDLAVRRDGNIYFTDSDWGTRPGIPHAPMGVYRVSPRGEVSRILDLEKPNGIALSPDESTLYVGSDVQAKVWKLPLDVGGVPGTPSVMIDGPAVPGGFKVPDGICVDDAGNLYVTNNDDDIKAIVVFDSVGSPLGRIPLPARPSNCTFGGPDRRTMYVTTLHQVYEIRMPNPGLP